MTSFYYRNKEYAKAKDCALSVSDKWEKGNSLIVHYLSRACAMLSQIDSARYYYTIASKYNTDALAKYVSLSIIEECAGNYKWALKYKENGHNIADSILQARNRQGVLQIEKRFDYHKVALQNQIIRNRNKVQTIVIISVSCVSVLLVIIMIMTIMHIRRELSAKLYFIEQLKSESDIAQNKFINELSLRNETESRLRAILEEKLTIFSQLADISYRYNSGRTNSGRDALLREYNKIIKVGKLGDSVFKDVCEIVNIQCAGVIEYFRKEHPTLNEDDLNFISLLCCGFTTSSICAFYGYKSLEVAYVRKSRLSKRMKLQMSIDDYIKNTINRLKNINRVNR